MAQLQRRLRSPGLSDQERLSISQELQDLQRQSSSLQQQQRAPEARKRLAKSVVPGAGPPLAPSAVRTVATNDNLESSSLYFFVIYIRLRCICYQMHAHTPLIFVLHISARTSNQFLSQTPSIPSTQTIESVLLVGTPGF